MKRKLVCSISLSAMLILTVGYVQAQTPGQIQSLINPARGLAITLGAMTVSIR
jgi:hypothetical protein